MQQLNFPNGDSSLIAAIFNTVSTPAICTIAVAIRLDTASRFGLSLSKGSTNLLNEEISCASQI